MQELAPEAALTAALGAVPGDILSGPVGLAVSGGSDSLALMHHAAGWASARGMKLLVLTVDHGLREGSATEADDVAAAARRLNLDHQTLRWAEPVPRQSAARRARHALLASALKAAGGHLLLTGHTADDQAETFLIRARQGSGWYGLACMRDLSLSPVWPEGAGVWIARPLIRSRRSTLRRYLEGQGAGWTEDPSNLNPDFERVRVRALLAGHPGLTGRVLALQARFALLRVVEDAALADWTGNAVTSQEGGGITARFAGLPPDRAARALGVLIQCVSGRGTPPRSEALVALSARLETPGFRGATLGGVRLRPGKAETLLRPEAARAGQAPSDGEIRARMAAFRRLYINSSQDIAAGSGKESFLRDLAPILPATDFSLVRDLT
ncbi:tRNA lysidine(34) synthetase TilS [Hyphomonas sp.]|uniref:tRNA lysidine(34) synthetase TilS n=1 Tax=Hyphomonas sp. TaxID=87 RepID=UPI00391B22D4